jgi:hypothetical protein
MEAEFVRDVLPRVPLAEAVLSLWRGVADPLFLLSVFARHCGAGYEKESSFGVRVQLRADAVWEQRGSGRKSLARGREQGRLTASIQAVYPKLGRVPLGLREAWLAESTARVRPVSPAAAGLPLPSALQGLQGIVVEGKAIKRVAKRPLGRPTTPSASRRCSPRDGSTAPGRGCGWPIASAVTSRRRPPLLRVRLTSSSALIPRRTSVPLPRGPRSPGRRPTAVRG